MQIMNVTATSDDNCCTDCNDDSEIFVPKVLGDLVEAIIGAIYIDSSGNIEAAAAFVAEHIINSILQPQLIDPLNIKWGQQRHPLSVLVEVHSSIGCTNIKNTIIKVDDEGRELSGAGGSMEGESTEEAVSHCNGKVKCVISVHEGVLSRSGVASNKIGAKKRAAAKLLGNNAFTYLERLKTICDCKEKLNLLGQG
jgi:dsRNA-specific ribonuclease